MSIKLSTEDARWGVREAAWSFEERVLWRASDASRSAIRRALRAIQPLLRNAEVGIPTGSHRTAQGYELFMICEELAAGAPIITREQIDEQLRNEALDEAAQTFLSNLRRTAVIEIRG